MKLRTIKGLPSGIKLKLNSLSDFKMIDKLYHASQAGVKIQLIVRGRPHPRHGMSENIEPSALSINFWNTQDCIFSKNGGHPKYFISSADFMTRN